MSFVHLHVHGEYSLLDGACKTKELVRQAKDLGMNSIALTDHGVMYGVIDFYEAAKEVGIKPIIGCEVYVAPGSRFDREANREEGRYYHLVLLAENDLGYKNLMKVVSKGFTEGFYYKPRVDKELLKQYHEGLICLSACLAGEVASWIRRGEREQAKKAILEYQEIFGRDNFFLELQDHGIPEQRVVNMELMKFAKELDIPLVATNDVHYIREEDAEAHDFLLCIQTNHKLNDENRMRYEGGQYFLKSEKQMKEVFPYIEEALENTQIVADRCNVEIEFGQQKVPQYDVPEGYDAYSYLEHLCEEGLKRRYPNVTEELKSRLNMELNVIKNMGYVDYFLIVWDFIHYSKEHDIPVGPGRGSAAGSIVAYCLEITNIDPIRYNLLFERFLNPERVSMPDIDIDFCYERRQEVIDYVVEKYGKEKVVQIVTFGTMKPRAVVRDVGRVLDMPYARVDAVAKAIPQELKITLDKALETSPDLHKMYMEDPEVRYLIDMAKKLEGLPRNSSMHAAGVVIGKEPIDEYVPLSVGNDGAVTTQFVMTTIERLGLLKMDFLGLRTLTQLHGACEMIGKTDAYLEQINYQDKNVYEMISNGRTEGVFQLESKGMKGFMTELKPGNLEDVIAGISLYRPGPMDFIPLYIQGKNAVDSIVYDTPELEEILAPTYGCIVYQEQVMQIVMRLAGYSLGRSDLVRRAMSKKKEDVMAKERQYFVYGNPDEGVQGCIGNGISEQVANKIFDDMTDFAKYAFNKSHAACYAVVAYQTAYMKYYHQVEFMASLINSYINFSDKVSLYINASRQMGIEILPPDVNYAQGKFSVTDGKMRFGMWGIKSVGTTSINNIVKEREEHGVFTSLQDFLSRMMGKDLNRRTVENLILAGALDSLPGNRQQKHIVYSSIMDGLNAESKHSMENQMTLFDFMEEDERSQYQVPFPDVPEYDKETRLALEKNVLGVYLSGHPLDEYESILRIKCSVSSRDFIKSEESEEFNVYDQQAGSIGGLIVDVNTKITRQGQNMAFLRVEDLYGEMEVVVFPRQYGSNRELLQKDKRVLIKGKVSLSEERVSFVASEILPLENQHKILWIRFDTMEQYEQQHLKLAEYIGEHPGENLVKIFIKEGRKMKNLGDDYQIEIDSDIMRWLMSNFGEENIAIK